MSPVSPDPLPRSYPGQAPALLARHMSKVFGTTRVLDDVELTVMPGEVHGLLGANGSGKSTLIKCLAGLHAPEAGAELILHGREARLPMPAGGARANGISFVHQHLALIPTLSVLENMMLNDLSVETRLRINWRAARRHVEEIFERFDLKIDPAARVADLSQPDRALLAIARAFDEVQTHAGQGQGILILDEPTPFLPKSGVDQLFGLMRAIVADGAAVIFVAHDIDEIREITDRATILRDGKLAGTVVSGEASHDDFIRHIVGESVDLFQNTQALPPAAPVVAKVRGLTAGQITDVGFDLREGEILGLTGLIGSGFDAVPEALFGVRPATGQLETGGKTLPAAQLTPAKAMAQGMAYLPADRLGRAGVGSLTLTENISLPVMGAFRNWFGIDWAGLRENCEALGRRFDVRPNRPDLTLGALSGGNAQKVLMAKWLQTKPKVLMLDEPTQGIDVGARQKLFVELSRAAGGGTAVLVASTDAEQLAQICHRVLVFAKGRIVSELSGSALTKDSITQETLRAHGAAPIPEVA
ncbi:sugar ABC transporter ATP-binding protein [Thioclava kandeliae]|uniref:Sugar ABC transporter ATP-binding protein n=1 Tax=Thioclava kandeliae TaxID=3070818 RepID=A0ABV1SEA6_9RHOB